MMKPLLILTVFLIGLPAFGQSTWRNFFTTNQNPIVEVVAGSNATVQASTVGVNLRRFTVNGTGSGSGSGQTNWPWQSITNLQSSQVPFTVITNAPWQTGSANLTNWGQLNTNVLSTLGQTNISYLAVTNAPWQMGSANLTNWGQLTTNVLSTLTNKLDTDLRAAIVNSTNKLDTDLRAAIVNSTNKLDVDLRSAIVNSTNKLDTDLRSIINLQPTDISTYRQTATFFDDFLYGTIGTSTAGNGPFGFISTVSSGTIGVPNDQSTHPGVIFLRSGGSSGTYASVAPVGAFGASFILGSMVITNEWCFRLTNTVTTADGGMFRIGLNNVPISSLTEAANGIYVRYNTNNTTFQYVCAQASSYTTNDSTVAVVANTWYKLRIVITNSASATFTINDANSWTATNNLPSTAFSIAPNFGVIKAAGSSQLGCEVDYCYLGYTLNAAR